MTSKSNNIIAIGIMIAFILVLLYCYCNRKIQTFINEPFYSPVLKLNIPEPPRLTS